MQSQVNRLKQRISGKEKEYNLIDIWHYMMVHYGYIPFEDFKKMDAYLVGELINRINKMNEEQSKGIPKGRSRRKF